jgi:cbb3-type cytochrome oxidase maturation protein
MNSLPYILIVIVMAGLMSSVIYGLWWAVRRGQFSDFQKGATCIFDDEEPIGFRTDAFPDEVARKT